MKEYSAIIDVFSREGYEMYSSTIPTDQWGNRQIAEEYLERYWLSSAEYNRAFKQVQDRIFINQDAGLPQIVFAPDYELQFSRGGCLFVQEEFVKLQECTQAISEQFLFVIENTFGGLVREPVFRMKFPTGISWDDLTKGNFVSAILFEMPHKDYFVFGETGTWGRYVANDYTYPLYILGFKQEVAPVFQNKFMLSETEERDIAESIPLAYKEAQKGQRGNRHK
jgi:hypothetical protein